jgi:hypothetical protein
MILEMLEWGIFPVEIIILDSCMEQGFYEGKMCNFARHLHPLLQGNFTVEMNMVFIVEPRSVFYLFS